MICLLDEPVTSELRLNVVVNKNGMMRKVVYRHPHRMKEDEMPPQEFVIAAYQNLQSPLDADQTLIFCLPDGESVHLIDPLDARHPGAALCAFHDTTEHELLNFEHGVLRVYIHESHFMNIKRENWRALRDGIQRLMSGLTIKGPQTERPFRIDIRSFTTPPESFGLEDNPFAEISTRSDEDTLPAEFSIVLPAPDTVVAGRRLARFGIDFVDEGAPEPVEIEQGIYTNAVFKVNLDDSINALNLMFRTIGQVIRYKQYFFLNQSIYHDCEPREMSEGFIHEFTVPGRDNDFAFLNEAFKSRGFQSKEFNEGAGVIVMQSDKPSKLEKLRERFNQQKEFTDPKFPSLLLTQSTKGDIEQARQMCEEFLDLWNGLLFVSMIVYGRNKKSVVFARINPETGEVAERKRWHEMSYFVDWAEEIDRVLASGSGDDALPLTEILELNTFQNRPKLKEYCWHVLGAEGPVFQRRIAGEVLNWFKENAQTIDFVYRSTHYANHTRSRELAFKSAFKFCARNENDMTKEKTQRKELTHMFDSGVRDLRELDNFFFWKFYTQLIGLARDGLSADIMLLERRR